jgi:hypothetical protein
LPINKLLIIDIKECINYARKKRYDDSVNWEYDGGFPNWIGAFKNLSPYIKDVMENIEKQAFPKGKEAYQKQRQESEITSQLSSFRIVDFNKIFNLCD